MSVQKCLTPESDQLKNHIKVYWFINKNVPESTINKYFCQNPAAQHRESPQQPEEHLEAKPRPASCGASCPDRKCKPPTGEQVRSTKTRAIEARWGHKSKVLFCLSKNFDLGHVTVLWYGHMTSLLLATPSFGLSTHTKDLLINQPADLY